MTPAAADVPPGDAAPPPARPARDGLVLLAAGLVVLGVASRVAIASAISTYLPTDAPRNLLVAARLLEGAWGSLPTIPHYLYGAAAAVASLGVFELAASARFVSLASGVGLVAMTGLIGARVGGRQVGWATAGVAALFPAFVDFSVDVLSESLYLFLAATGIWVGLAALERSSLRTGALAGAALALAFHARPEGLVVAVGCATLLLAIPLARRRGWLDGPAELPWRSVLGLAASFVLLVVPYVLYLKLVFGSWALSGYQINESYRSMAGAYGVELAESLASASDILYSSFHPHPVVRTVEVVRRAYLLGIPWLMPPLVLVLAGVGLARAVALRQGGWLFLAPLALLSPLYASVTLPLVIARYYLLTAVVLLPFVGAGVVQLASGRRRWPGTLALGVVALSFLPELVRLPATAPRPPAALVERLGAGEPPASAPLLTNSLSLAVLSGRPEVQDARALLTSTPPDALAGRAEGPLWVAVQLRGDGSYHAAWESPGGPDGGPVGMEPVGRYPAVGGPFVVYLVGGG